MLGCQTRWICGISSSERRSRMQRKAGLRARAAWCQYPDEAVCKTLQIGVAGEARPRTPPGTGRYMPSGLGPMVERRLGKKRAGRLEDVVGSAQFLDFALQSFEALARADAQPIAHVSIGVLALAPFQQGLEHAADLRRNRFNSCPERGYSPRCSCIRRTACSRISGENLFVLFMAPSSQKPELPQNGATHLLPPLVSCWLPLAFGSHSNWIPCSECDVRYCSGLGGIQELTCSPEIVPC
jgi:hypothetical protein